MFTFPFASLALIVVTAGHDEKRGGDVTIFAILYLIACVITSNHFFPSSPHQQKPKIPADFPNSKSGTEYHPIKTEQYTTVTADERDGYEWLNHHLTAKVQAFGGVGGDD